MYIDSVGLLVILSTIWVYLDCADMQRRGLRISTGVWPLLCFIGWCLAFPLYVFVTRPDYLRRLAVVEKSKKQKHMACPSCGEQVLAIANICRHCHQPIADSDRPKTRPALNRRNSQ